MLPRWPLLHSNSGRSWPKEAEVDAAARKIASVLHETCCRYDHTEGCSWETYDRSWDEGAHLVWFRRAKWVIDNAYGAVADAAASPQEKK